MRIITVINSILLFSLTSGLQAQYLPILTAGHKWSVVEIHCQPEGNTYSSSKLIPGPDTTFFGTGYKTIWKNDNETAIYYGAFREEETTGRSWYRIPYSESEGLVYDFSLQPGDTATLVNQLLGTDTIRLVVTGRDSVLMNQQWRTRLFLTNFSLSWQEWWIEGIGSQGGVLNAGSSFYTGICGSQELLCFWEGSVQTFQNPAYPVCEFVAAALNEEEIAEEIKVFPNPAQQSFNITYAARSAKLTLMDIQGKLITEEITTGGNYRMNVSSLQGGIYVLKIATDQQTVIRRLVVDHR